MQRLGVHAFHATGVEIIHASKNARRVRNDGIGVGGTQIHGSEPLHDLVHHAGSRFDAQLERGVIGHTRAVRV